MRVRLRRRPMQAQRMLLRPSHPTRRRHRQTQAPRPCTLSAYRPTQLAIWLPRKHSMRILSCWDTCWPRRRIPMPRAWAGNGFPTWPHKPAGPSSRSVANRRARLQRRASTVLMASREFDSRSSKSLSLIHSMNGFEQKRRKFFDIVFTRPFA